MADWLIEARNVTKRYRLYAQPRYRFMDIFGLLRQNRGHYHEHVALQDVNLCIARGEKVGLIGRNGAGKSTFLRLITQVIKPTSGELIVNGATMALLQIGTGFHPEFTGRENALAYLAHLGITGQQARRKLADIIEFTELEEYIDQPFKTYSTGMGARLMFAASTAIAPEVLVLDEVLGVGDAYFAHKSFERIQEMCSGDHTTVLFVSHDVYSVIRMCERVIWLERGRVVMDSDAQTVVKAYEDSIREQEENRLRLRQEARLKELTLARAASSRRRLTVEIGAALNRPQPSVVYFHEIALCHRGTVLTRLPLASASVNPAESHLQFDPGCWGELVPWKGRSTRRMNNYGSPFHKVSGVFLFDVPTDAAFDDLEISVTYYSEQACDLVLRAYHETGAFELGPLPPAAGTWAAHKVRLGSPLPVTATPAAAMTSEINVSGVHGSGAVVITDVRMLDHQGRQAHIIQHGQPATLQIHYEVHQPDLDEHVQVLVAFQRDGTTEVCRCLTRELAFRAADGLAGMVELQVPALPLTAGAYAISIMMAKEGYYDREQTRFFTINPDVYCCVSRIIEVRVVDAPYFSRGTMMVLDGVGWRLVPAPADATLRAAG